MRERKRLLSTLLVLLAATLGVLHLSGCSSHPVNPNDPASLLQDAEDDIKGDRYQIATDKLRMIKNRFPYSPVAIDAALRLADVYYMQESFAESAAAYEAFADLHPKHPKVPYALFRAAKSYFNDLPSTVARDLSSGEKAEAGYREFLHRFPDAPEAAEAKKDLADTRKMLAQKQVYIGDFYARQEQYDSAVPRYRKAIEMYGDTDVAKEASEKLAKAMENAARTNSKSASSSQ